MILVDTSIWVAHLKGMREAAALTGLLHDAEVLCHPFVLGELVLGGLAAEPRALLQSLPRVQQASNDEVFALVGAHRLAGRGIGWVDAHLLASARLSEVALWTRDTRLASVAADLGLEPPPGSVAP